MQCGARIGDGWQKIFDGFKRNGFKTFEVLEVFDKNVAWLKKQKQWPCIVHYGDIRKIDEIDSLIDRRFDVITFHHGMEHLTKLQAYKTIPKITKRCKIYFAGMPYGKWIQEDIKGNPYERHLSHWYPEELEELGFDVWVFNDPKKKPGPDNENVMFGILYEEKFGQAEKVCRRKILEQG